MIKFLHVLGVVLFLGNIIFGALWRFFADRTGNGSVVRSSVNTIVLLDWVFTLPGAILIGITGHMLAPKFGGIAAFSWIYHSYAMLTVGVLIWLVGLVPIQLKQKKLLAADESAFGGEKFQKLNTWWRVLDAIVFILPLIALYWMVLRPI